MLVLGSGEQIHEAFDVITLERMQEVPFAVRDPKKPKETRGKREKHTCLSDTDWEGHFCLQGHRGRCGKHSCIRLHGDNNTSVGSSCGETCWETCTEETSRCHRTRTSRFLRKTRTERECPNSADEKRDLFHTQTMFRLRPIHAKAMLEGRGQWCALCETDHQRWTRNQEEGHACVDRLQVDVGDTPRGVATRKKRRAGLHLQSTERRTDKVLVYPCCQTNLAR